MRTVARRAFLAAAAASYQRVLGANERIRVGCIGLGINGHGMLRSLVERSGKPGSGFQIAALSEIYDRRKERGLRTARLDSASVHHDYLELLARTDIDAVIISVPDHLHAGMAIDAMAAGKDVYLQKPMTLTIDEARDVTNAAERHGRVLQVGSQHLSDRRYHTARELIAAGEIGTLLWAQSTYSRNSLAGEWNYFIEPEATASTVDWKRWLGKAPARPFSAERYFRWRKYWDYSGGIATDLFYHRLGPLLFAMGPKFPSRVSASGGIYLQKDREVPDTYSTTVEYEDFFITLSGSMANAAATGLILPAIYGHKGTIVIEAAGLRVLPEPTYQSRLGAGDQKAGKFIPIEQPELNEAHTNDFFACMRSRSKPVLNPQLGWQIMTAIRLGVDSYRQGRQMLFDAQSRRVIGRAGQRASYEGRGENHPSVRPR